MSCCFECVVSPTTKTSSVARLTWLFEPWEHHTASSRKAFNLWRIPRATVYIYPQSKRSIVLHWAWFIFEHSPEFSCAVWKAPRLVLKWHHIILVSGQCKTASPACFRSETCSSRLSLIYCFLQILLLNSMTFVYIATYNLIFI